jgi:hypothetical protein
MGNKKAIVRYKTILVKKNRIYNYSDYQDVMMNIFNLLIIKGN